MIVSVCSVEPSEAVCVCVGGGGGGEEECMCVWGGECMCVGGRGGGWGGGWVGGRGRVSVCRGEEECVWGEGVYVCEGVWGERKSVCVWGGGGENATVNC